MGTPYKLSLERIIEIAEMLKEVEGNTKLPYNIQYRLGRLFDRCKSKARAFEKVQNNLRKEIGEAIISSRGGKKWDEMTEEEKVASQDLAKEKNEEFVKQIEALMSEEEQIEIPEFTLENFKGADLPTKFFNVMGEFIKE